MNNTNCIHHPEGCPIPFSNGTEVAWVIAHWDRAAAAAKYGTAWIGTSSELQAHLWEKPELLQLGSRRISYQLKMLGKKCPELVKIVPPSPRSHKGTVYKIMLQVPLPDFSRLTAPLTTDGVKPKRESRVVHALLDRMANWAEFETQVIRAAKETGVLDECDHTTAKI